MAIMGRIRTVFTGVAGTPWYSNFYVLGTEDDAAAQIDSVGEFWASIASIQTGVVDWTVEGDVTQIDSATGQTVGVTSESPVNGGGTSSGDPLPYANQALIQLHTGSFVGGREVRGRCFVPGLTEETNSVGTLTSGADGTITAAAAALLTALNTSWVVYSPTKHVAPAIVSINVPSKFAVLRSRRD